MSLPLPLHASRLEILYVLRHSPKARYTDLMQSTGLESDVFKFHLRILVQNHLVDKNDDGTYSLTLRGKEFANDLDEETGQRSHSPKLSMLLIARRNDGSQPVYLFQRRQRAPFYGYWGLISAPVVWGKSIEECAKEELMKQTGLSGEVAVQGFCRIRDYLATDHSLLEDKLFAVVAVKMLSGELHDWSGGVSEWMTLAKLELQPKRFAITSEVLRRVDQSDPYFEIDTTYTPDDY